MEQSQCGCAARLHKTYQPAPSNSVVLDMQSTTYPPHSEANKSATRPRTQQCAPVATHAQTSSQRDDSAKDKSTQDQARARTAS